MSENKQVLTDERILAIVSAAPAGPTAESEWLYVCRKVEAAVLSASAGEKKDAERYRKLREYPVSLRMWGYGAYFGKQLDERVDRIAASKSNQEQSTNKDEK